MSVHSRRVVGLALVFYLVAVGRNAQAQESVGRISGRVVDSAGMSVPNQRVHLRVPNEPLQLVVITDVDGGFTYPKLSVAGRYVVQVVVEDRVMAERVVTLSPAGAMCAEVTVTLPAPPPTPPGYRTARADTLLKGGPPLTSFDDVASILQRGHEVIVMESDGRRTRGFVSSVSSDGLVLFRNGNLLRKAVEETYRPDAIQRIEIVDSHRNGVLLGLAASVGIFAAVRACRGECQGEAAYGVIGFMLAPIIGWGIDDAINAPIYERQRQANRVSVGPLYRREAVGFTVRVGF